MFLINIVHNLYIEFFPKFSMLQPAGRRRDCVCVCMRACMRQADKYFKGDATDSSTTCTTPLNLAQLITLKTVGGSSSTSSSPGIALNGLSRTPRTYPSEWVSEHEVSEDHVNEACKRCRDS